MPKRKLIYPYTPLQLKEMAWGAANVRITYRHASGKKPSFLHVECWGPVSWQPLIPGVVIENGELLIQVIHASHGIARRDYQQIAPYEFAVREIVASLPQAEFVEIPAEESVYVSPPPKHEPEIPFDDRLQIKRFIGRYCQMHFHPLFARIIISTTETGKLRNVYNEQGTLETAQSWARMMQLQPIKGAIHAWEGAAQRWKKK